MANEKRLIDANAVDYENIMCSLSQLHWLNAIIEKQPTVDAVEVVRCKDCHWWRKINIKNGSGLCRHEVFSVYDCTQDPQTDPDDFCSYGERKRQ